MANLLDAEQSGMHAHHRSSRARENAHVENHVDARSLRADVKLPSPFSPELLEVLLPLGPRE